MSLFGRLVQSGWRHHGLEGKVEAMQAGAFGWDAGLLTIPMDWTRNWVKLVYLRSGGYVYVCLIHFAL